MNDIVYKPFFRNIADLNIQLPSIDIQGYRPKYNKSDNTKLPEENSTTVKEDSTPVKEDNSQNDIEEINTVESPIIEIKEKFQENPIYHGDKYDAFVKAYNSSGADPNKFNFFAKLASKESGFDPYIQNQLGAPAYGYFQFMQGTSNGRSWDNISRFANADIETFRNSPKLQIQAAQKLADAFLKGFSKEDYKKARELGYSDSALLAGAWLGGVGGVRKFLHKGISVDDKSWSKDKKTGTDVEARMREFNNMFKHGGLIKLQKGGIGYKEKEWVRDWYKNRTTQLKSNYKNNARIPLPVTGKLIYNILTKNLDSTSITEDPSKLDTDVLGKYNLLKRKIYLKDKNDTNTAIHEWTHASRPDVQTAEVNRIKNTFGNAIYHNSNVEPSEYLDSAEELYARTMTFRKWAEEKFNFGPEHVWTPEELEKLQKEYTQWQLLVNNKYVSEFDKDDNLINTRQLENQNNLDLNKSKLYINMDVPKETIDFLDRYNPKFLTRILNDVAEHTNKKDTTIYAKQGIKI